MTDPKNVRRWLRTLATHYPSLLVSGVAHNALAEIERLEEALEEATDRVSHYCEAFKEGDEFLEKAEAKLAAARAEIERLEGDNAKLRLCRPLYSRRALEAKLAIAEAALEGLAAVMQGDCGVDPCINSMAPAERHLGLARAAIAKIKETK